jgi:hypothetical protein
MITFGGGALRSFGFGVGPTIINITSTTTNYNLFTAAGSPTVAKNIIVNINSGVTVGATAGSTAFTVGQFPTGSTIVINNFGNIQGYGGAASGTGGDAINANYANQTVTINNQTGATIYGGGGGGGTGGAGGVGGTGGGGYYLDSYYNYAYSLGDYVSYVVIRNNTTGALLSATWAGFQVPLDVSYVQGAFVYNSGGNAYYQIGQLTYYNVYTSGGGGGGGGSGGGGGVGQGYGQAAAGGAGGSPGAGGSGGGTNAGAGGSGGYGGTGGTGGTFGNAGGTGASGYTGNTGDSGNNGGGAGGSSGGGGSGGGAAGRYLVKGANSVTLNNSGTVLGGLA